MSQTKLVVIVVNAWCAKHGTKNIFVIDLRAVPNKAHIKP